MRTGQSGEFSESTEVVYVVASKRADLAIPKSPTRITPKLIFCGSKNFGIGNFGFPERSDIVRPNDTIWQ